MKKVINIKKLLLLYLFLFSVKLVSSQEGEAVHFLFDKFSISPAYAGYNQNIESFLNYEQKWVGIAGSPQTQSLNFNAPYKEKIGYGLTVKNKQAGNFKHFEITPAYAYKLELSEILFLSFGINAVFYKNQIEISKVHSQGFDPQLQNANSLKSTSFDAGAGIVANYGRLSSGITVPYLLAGKSKYSNTDLNYQKYRSWTAFASYPVVAQRIFYFDPTFIVRAGGEKITSNFHWTTSLLFRYKRKMWVGASIETGNRAGISMGGAISDKIILNYNYNLGFTGIAGASAGTHNFTLGFLIKRNTKRIEPTIFTVKETVTQLETNNEKIEDLTAQIDLIRKQSNKILNKHKIEIEKLNKNIDSLNALTGNKNKNLYKAPEKWEKPIILSNIKFGKNSDKLFSSSFSEINKIVYYMIQNPKAKVQITGYTDNQGSSSYNQYLSENRAKAIAAYMRRRGTDPARITSKGKGGENPIGNNNTKEGREKNKRIEIRYNIP